MTLCKPRWVMGLAMVLALALSGDALAAKKVLRIKLDGPVAESPGNDNPFSMLMAGQKPPTLYGLIQEIEKAGKDADIGGIILVLDQPQVGLAHVEELTRALKSFRTAGKKVLCYTDHASNSSYAMACAADFVMLAENSELDIVGPHAEMEYYKGMLDKLGLEMEMLHCGAFKSALEPFVRTEPSKEAAENINWLLDGIYNRWVTLLADGRNQTPEQIKAAIDTAPLLVEEALKRKLIDSTGS
ncbi:MAG: S49 family peptidase [Planctomycetes bacterium]|nr:S49 family peptidase [Planctomycetota bacterium]